MSRRWLLALACMALPVAMAQPLPFSRALPLADLKSGLYFSGKDVQALQADEFANPAQLWLSQGAALWGASSQGNATDPFGSYLAGLRLGTGF